MADLTDNERRELAARIAHLKIGDAGTFHASGHSFAFACLNDQGLHSGRFRFMVACVTCEALLHEATTGPESRIGDHLRHAAIAKSPALELTGPAASVLESAIEWHKDPEDGSRIGDLKGAIDVWLGRRAFVSPAPAAPPPAPAAHVLPFAESIVCPLCRERGLELVEGLERGSLALPRHHIPHPIGHYDRPGSILAFVRCPASGAIVVARCDGDHPPPTCGDPACWRSEVTSCCTRCGQALSPGTIAQGEALCAYCADHTTPRCNT